MGVALKRRDSAPIVKDIFGGALDILLEQRNILPAQDFVKKMLVNVLQNKLPLEKFIITKQLRDDYKNPSQIAHRVLADRMEERDAGNAPRVGERLAYIYVENRKDAKKQGDRIEHVDYVREKKLKPDTEFYITNQIQNPVAQLFALAIEDLEGYIPKKYPVFPDLDEEESILKVLGQKEKDLESILFMKSDYILRAQGKPIQQKIDMFLKRST
jgi:DNA polymerase elongation subunit (family B)